MRHDIIRRRTFALVLLVTLAIGSSVRAQAVEDQTPAPAQTEPKPAIPPPTPPPPIGMANVKMDITITDQAGTSKPTIKTINVIVADRANNQIRSQVYYPVATRTRIAANDSRTGQEVVDQKWRTEELPLNIDLRADVIDATRVRTRLVLNYRTVTESTTLDGQPARTSMVTEEVSTILESGKPTIISQSADAATDRKVTVEVKAVIQK
jgi:hypothetical protein